MAQCPTESINIGQEKFEIKLNKPTDVQSCKFDQTKEAIQEYSYELCSEIFHSSKSLQLHKQTTHMSLKQFHCEKCPDQFNLEKNLIMHVAGHDKAPATCPECGVHFRRTAGYHGHLKVHMINDNFHCKKCDEEFQFETQYRQHIESNHTQSEANDYSERAPRMRKIDGIEGKQNYKPYSCDICGSRYTKSSNLNRHRLTHSGVKPFQCDMCSSGFTQKTNLQRHYLLHSEKKAFKCSKCSMSFSQRGNLQTHIERVHPRNSDLSNKFPCAKCSCVFNKLNSLNRHSGKEHAKKLSSIDDNQDEDSEYSFNKVMTQLKDLQRDMNLPINNLSSKSLSPVEKLNIVESTSVNDQRESIKCAQESGSFVKIVNMLNAEEEKSEVLVKQVERNDGKIYYSCDHCSKTFQRPYNLLRHIRVHTKEKPYECGICGRCFSIKSNLQVHLRIHGKDNNRITNCFQCPECFTQFSSVRQLDSHVRSHEGLKLFPCDICGKRFRSNNNLRVHKYTHRYESTEKKELLRRLEAPIKQGELNNAEDDRRFQCSICGLKFKRLSHLSQHELNHTGLKPFECLTCKRQFPVKSSLNTHQKIHSGHKTKECDECGVKFHSNTELTRHKAMHSSVRPYACPYCIKSFKTKATCKRHILTHLNESSETDVYNIYQHDAEERTSNFSQDAQTIPARISEYPENQNFLFDTDSGSQIIADESYLRLKLITNQNDKQQKSNSPKFIEIEELIHLNPTKSLAKTITVESANNSIPSLNPTETTPASIGTSLPLKSASRMHVCETCGRTFKKPIDLRRHIRTHTDDRPFKCDLCNAAFKLKCTLDCHMQIHYQNRSKFDCTVCGKAYASQDVLSVHLRIHTNERPYKCSLCAKTFRTTGHRDSHMRTHSKSPKESKKIIKKTAIILNVVAPEDLENR